MSRTRSLLILLLVAASCTPPVSHHLSGSLAVFGFSYHSELIIEQAQRLAGGDYFGLPEEERDAVWIDAAGLVRGTPCGDGIEPFPTVRTGVAVQVVDTGGSVVGAGTLSGGFVDLLSYPDVQAKVIAVCRFEFEVPDLPDSGDYTLLIDDQEPRVIPKAQLEADGWTVTLELGVRR